jgi:hypothetical protein
MSAYINWKEIDSEVSNINYMDPGIHENCEMLRIVVDTSPNGNHFIAFYFENEDGKSFSHTEWEPKETDPVKLENKTNNLAKRIKHIATKYVSKEVIENITATDFESMCKEIVKAIGDKFKGVKVRLKVTYNNKNFTSFPNYVPFMENMTIAKTKLNIRSIDKMVKDAPDKEATPTTNPFEPTVPPVATATANDGNPF